MHVSWKEPQMRVFVLEDMEERMKSFRPRYMKHVMRHAKTYQEAVDILTQEDKFDFMTLDHDLNDVHYRGMYNTMYEKTGLHVVEFIINELPKEKWPDEIVIHSYNVPRAKMMELMLRKAGIPVSYKPFAPEPDFMFDDVPQTGEHE